MNIELVRFAYLPECTLGWLTAGDQRFATLAPAWVRNPEGPGGMPEGPGRRGSCVPDGQYKLEPHDSPDHPNTYRLVNIGLGVFADVSPYGASAGRTNVLLHTGNTIDNTEGCILVATSFGMIQSRHAIVDSVRAFDKLREILGRNSHVLNIRASRGTEE